MAIYWLCIGFLGLGISTVCWWLRIHVVRYGDKVEGTVTSMEWDGWLQLITTYSLYGYMVEYRTAEGNIGHTRLASLLPGFYKPGQKIQLILTPQMFLTPKGSARINSPFSLYGEALVLTVLSLLALLLGTAHS